MTGGGSGGHITPILAVANELKRQQPGVKIVYIGQRGDALLDIPANDPNIDEVHTIWAGKFRRYHGEGWKQLLDIPTQARNVRDIFLILAGMVQSFWLLGKLQPKVIFTRGGFVSVPVAFGASLRRIPYMTHDSDSIPSLANRLIARRAYLHAVALPEELYPYPQAKTKMVGVPVGSGYEPVTPELLQQYRKELDLEEYKQVLMVTGGGNGAALVNNVLLSNAAYLLQQCPELAIVHFAGRSLQVAVEQGYQQALPAEDVKRVKVLGFSTDFYKYSGAADVIVARGGATNLAEFAIQRKACVIIPAKQLVWAVKNTEALSARQAVMALTEEQAEQERRLATVLIELFKDNTKRQQLSDTLATYARPNAAHDIAALLIEKASA